MVAAIVIYRQPHHSVEGMVFLGLIRLLWIRDKANLKSFVRLEFTVRGKIYQTDYPSRRIIRPWSENGHCRFFHCRDECLLSDHHCQPLLKPYPPQFLPHLFPGCVGPMYALPADKWSAMAYTLDLIYLHVFFNPWLAGSTLNVPIKFRHS